MRYGQLRGFFGAGIFLAACGPSLSPENGSAETGSTTASSSSAATSVDPLTVGVECLPDASCPSGMSCDGVCTPPEECADSCCPGDPSCGSSTTGILDGSGTSEPSGTTGGVVSCANDQECPPLHLCESRECIALETPSACGPVITLDRLGELQASAEIRSLSVSENEEGFDDLVLGLADGAEVIHGRISFEPHPLVDPDVPNGSVVAAAGADFDGDGRTDIALGIDPGDGSFAVRVHVADVDGDYVAIGGDATSGAPRDLQAYQDAAGEQLLAQRDPSGELLRWSNNGAGVFAGVRPFDARQGLETFLVGRFSGNPLSDVVLDYGAGTQLELRVEGGVTPTNGYVGRPGRTLRAANLDGSSSDQIIGITAFDGWTMVEWIRPDSGAVTTFAVEGAALNADTSDLSDNERDDLVLRTETDFVVLFGREEVGFVCQDSFAADASYESMVVAEVTGDDRPDVVVSSGDRFTVYEPFG